MSDSKKDIKIISLTKFAPDEYHLWAAQTESTFVVRKVWDIVVGIEQCPGPASIDDGDPEVASTTGSATTAQVSSATRKKIVSWNERQALARQALLTCLDKATLTRVVHLKSA
jgi:hypothetical protein